MQLTEPIVRTALDYADGSATRTGAAFDARGVDEVLAIVKFATIAASAVTTVKMQQSDSSTFASGVEDIAGSSISVAETADNGIAASLVVKPTKAYVRVHITKNGTNNSAESAVYVGLGLRQTNASLNSGVSGLQYESNPGIAGTA